MWFRNLSVYRVPQWNLDAAQLEEALSRRPLQDCGAMDMETRGWVAPKGDGEPLVHRCDGHLLLALGVEQKLLPSSVIKQYAQARAEEIEEQQGYRPGRKQMRDIRDRVTEELLPRAFTRRRTTHAWIDRTGGWLVIDAASSAKADELIETLRKSVENIPLALLKTRLSPAGAMTAWLADDEAPSGFTIDRDCEMLSPGEDKATVRYVRHPLEPKEIRGHIEGGKQVTRLGMTWSDRISFVLHENLQVKRLDFLDILKERPEQQSVSADEQFDGGFAIMTGELSRFLPDLVESLGGEQEN